MTTADLGNITFGLEHLKWTDKILIRERSLAFLNIKTILEEAGSSKKMKRQRYAWLRKLISNS